MYTFRDQFSSQALWNKFSPEHISKPDINLRPEFGEASSMPTCIKIKE